MTPFEYAQQPRSVDRLFLMLALAVTGPVLSAAVGDLDTAFGDDGVVTRNLHVTDGYDSGVNAAYQPDGKLLCVGTLQRDGQNDVVVYRLTADGGYDTSFSGDGRFAFDHAGADDSGRAVLVDASGRILVAATVEEEILDDGDPVADDRWAVIRLTANGERDASFGDDGVALVDPGHVRDDLVAMALDGQGRIVLGGDTRVGNDPRVAVARLTADGQADPDFATDGLAIINLVGSNNLAPEHINGIGCDSEDRIVFGGEHGAQNKGSPVGRGYIARLTTTGVRDGDFGDDGVRNFQASSAQITTSYGDTRVLADGGALWTGLSWIKGFAGDSGLVTVVKVDADGEFDTTFDEDGMASVKVADLAGDLNCSNSGIMPLGDGGLLVASRVYYSLDGDLAPALVFTRFAADGSLVTAAGGDGFVTYTDNTMSLGLRCLAIDDRAGQPRIACIGGNRRGDLHVAVVDDEGALVTDFADGGRFTAQYPLATLDRIDGQRRDAAGRLLIWGAAETTSARFPAVARMTTAGRLDTSFAGDGVWVSEEWPGPVQDLVEDPDGGLLVALGREGDLVEGAAVLGRLTAAGVIDGAFGDDGLFRYPGTGRFDAVAVSGERIYAVGSTRTLNDTDALVVGLTSEGAIDADFADDGILTYDGSASSYDKDLLTAAAISGERLLVAGSASGTGQPFLALACDLDGVLDTTFGEAGVLTRAVSSDNRQDRIAFLQPLADGRVIGVGASERFGRQGDLLVAMFDADGLDGDFGDAGVRIVDIDGERADEGLGVAATETGFIIVGRAENSILSRPVTPVATALTASGAIDAAFGRRVYDVHPGLRSFAGVVVDGSRALIAGDGPSDAILAGILIGESDGEPPVIAEGDAIAVEMDEDSAPRAFELILHASDADSTALSWSVATAAEHGRALVGDPATGTSQPIAYQPDADFHGTDRFTVVVSDGFLSDSIVVTVTVVDQPDEPGGVPEFEWRYQGAAVADAASLDGPDLVAGAASQLLRCVVANVGDGNLSLDTAQLQGVGGVVAQINQHPPTALAPGNSATIVIELTAVSEGGWLLTLVLPNDDDDESDASLQFSGEILAGGSERRIRIGAVRSGEPISLQISVDQPGAASSEDEATGIWTIEGLESALPTLIDLLEQAGG